jgi:hypothetical protein
MSSFIAKNLDDSGLQDDLRGTKRADRCTANVGQGEALQTQFRPKRRTHILESKYSNPGRGLQPRSMASDLRAKAFSTRSIFLQRKAARSVLAVKGFTSAKPAPLTKLRPDLKKPLVLFKRKMEA